MEKICLFHTGFQVIKEIDLQIGRKNADFGQGFYLTPDYEFSKRWAKERKKEATIVNHYSLSLDHLKVKTLSRDEEWFHYIYGNRRGMADEWKDFDVIMGPIANDTIYNVNGITTSGLLDEKQSLPLLQIGPVYTQYVLKTKKAVDALTWISSEVVDHKTVAAYRELVIEEEEQFQTQFAEILEKVLA